jgi:hypothetical protein
MADNEHSSNIDFRILSAGAAAHHLLDARGTRDTHCDDLICLRNVVAVGVGFKNRERLGIKEVCVVASVEKKLPLNELVEKDRIPSQIGNFRTDVVETGRFQAQSFRLQSDHIRPARPGCSISPTKITAGTFGCVVSRDGMKFILSNNHVLADMNRAALGEPILQPGTFDMGNPGVDRIGSLVEYVPLMFDGEEAPPQPKGCGSNLRFLAGRETAAFVSINAPGANKVDCALGKPDDDDLISTDILGIGTPKGIELASLGTRVQKSGRTTGLTYSEIEQIDVTTKVDYEGRTATFVGQLMASQMSEPGDSGSAVLDMNGYVVGLLFAGSGNSTLIHPIQDVLEALRVEVVTH